MAREDILTALQIALTQKEGPPAPDANVLLQKMMAPNDSITPDDSSGVTLSVLDPSTFVWGGNVQQVASVMGAGTVFYVTPNWKYGQGQYK
jgi:hypothetical protein